MRRSILSSRILWNILWLSRCIGWVNLLTWGVSYRVSLRWSWLKIAIVDENSTLWEWRSGFVNKVVDWLKIIKRVFIIILFHQHFLYRHDLSHWRFKKLLRWNWAINFCFFSGLVAFSFLIRYCATWLVYLVIHLFAILHHIFSFNRNQIIC